MFQWCGHHPLFQVAPDPQYEALQVGVVCCFCARWVLYQVGFGSGLQDKPRLTGPLSFPSGAKLQHHNRPVPLRGGQHLQVV